MVHNKTGITKSDGPREFSTGPPMAISPLWCSRVSVFLFYTLMMEVKDVGEIKIEYELRRNAISATWKRLCYGLEMHQLSCVGTLVVADGNGNQYSYIDLMGGNLLESVEQMFRDQQHLFVFQPDNAPCHIAMVVLTWFKNNAKRKMLFSPQSPDRNPIKNICSCMKKNAWEVKPTTCKEIKAALSRSSDRIRPAKIRTVFSSSLRRAAAIIRSRG